jgi:hypothetical protein
MHRIPYGPHSSAAHNKQPVFLQHGLTGSSSDWIILGPKKSLGELDSHLHEFFNFNVLDSDEKIFEKKKLNFYKCQRHVF